jgi:hypothetical protein
VAAAPRPPTPALEAASVASAPRPAARPAGGESDGDDGSAAIDWLLKDRRR